MFKGVSALVYVVEKDNDSETFPVGLLVLPEMKQYDKESVEELTLRFSVSRDVKTVELKLARMGSESNMVSLNSGEWETEILAADIGSGESGIVGIAELSIPIAQPGQQTLRFWISDYGISRGKGNGTFAFDAIELTAVH
jgi:hypothetical protein